MLKIAMIPILTRAIAKLDMKPIVAALKGMDIFTVGESPSPEKYGELAAVAVTEITPQLGNIGAEIPEIVATYKGVTIAEAGEMDFFAVVEEIMHDEGILSFFKRALSRKPAQET